jgi:hypothetical protein
MTLAILAGVAAWLMLAVRTSRRLYGVWTYKDWKEDQSRFHASKMALEDYEYGIGGEWFGALMLSIVALPLVAFYTATFGGKQGGWAVLPKSYTQERELKAQADRIRQLEQEAGIE